MLIEFLEWFIEIFEAFFVVVQALGLQKPFERPKLQGLQYIFDS